MSKPNRHKQTIHRRRRSSKQTLAGLAARIAAEHRAYVEAEIAFAKRGLKHSIAAGRLLIEAKDQVGHGKWLAWLRHHCKEVPERTAQHYMHLARHESELLKRLKSATVADLSLSVRDAIRLLTSPIYITGRDAVPATATPVSYSTRLLGDQYSRPLAARPAPHRKIVAVNYIPQVSDPPDPPVAPHPPRIGAPLAEANRIADLIEHYIHRLASSVNDALAGSGDLLALIVDRIERADVAQELADIQSFAARLKQTTIEATATCDGDNVIAFPPQDSDEPEPEPAA